MSEQYPQQEKPNMASSNTPENEEDENMENPLDWSWKRKLQIHRARSAKLRVLLRRDGGTSAIT